VSWLFLALAIGAEVTATLSLKASEGFSKLGPSIVVVVGYVTAFVLLGLTIRELPIGLAYALWAGLGTVGATVGGLVFFGERLPSLVIAGIAVVVVGVVMITLGRATH
jgi:small multidrug resistance pump